MVTKQDLFTRWEDLKKSGIPRGAIKISQAGNLRQYCSISEDLSLSFTVTSKSKPPKFTAFSSVSVVTEEDAGEAGWILNFKLLDSDFTEEFATLCLDMIFSIQSVGIEEIAQKKQHSAYENWIAFYKRASLMGLEVARGLFGELEFIKQKLLSNRDVSSILEAWKGPLQGPQDFQLESSGAVEIKTMQSSAYEIKISSEAQLTYPGKLTLAICTVSDNGDNGQGSTLVELAGEIESSFDSLEKQKFRSLLSRVGFSPENEICAKRRFECESWKFYDANADGFPKIGAQDLNPIIRKVKYSISVPHLNQFEIQEWSI